MDSPTNKLFQNGFKPWYELSSIGGIFRNDTVNQVLAFARQTTEAELMALLRGAKIAGSTILY